MDVSTKRHFDNWCKANRCNAILRAEMTRIYNDDPVYFGGQSWAVCWQHASQSLRVKQAAKAGSQP